MKMVSLKQSCNQIQEISCVPNTHNTMVNFIGALVRRSDGDTSLLWIVDIGFCNLKNIKTTSLQVIKWSTNGLAMLRNKASGSYFH